MSRIKAVLFDLDDTLWPIVPAIERAERVLYDWLHANAPEVACEVSIESMRARRQALMASDPVYQIDLRALRRAVLAEAFQRHGGDPALVETGMDVFSRARNEVEPFDDVLPGLNTMRTRVMLGSISNGVADLDAIGLAHFFQTSIAAYHFGRAKPDRSIFLAACNTLGVAPHEAVYVGDDPLLDVVGAQRAGLRAVWMNRELHPGRAFPAQVQPDATCKDLHDLNAWLDERLQEASC